MKAESIGNELSQPQGCGFKGYMNPFD